MSLAQLEALASAGATAPRFVLLHLPVPHPPAIFRADCTPGSGDSAVVREGAQLTCVDGLLTDAISTIIHADPEAVILLLSDHGPELGIDWSTPDDTSVANRMATWCGCARPVGTGCCLRMCR